MNFVHFQEISQGICGIFKIFSPYIKSKEVMDENKL